MQTLPKLIFISLTCLLVTACAGVQVRQDYAPDYDFSSVNTYAWDTGMNTSAGTSQPVPLQTQRIHAAIKRALSDRGLVESDSNPDVKIKSSYRIEQRTEYRSYPSLGFWHRDPFDHEIVSHDYEVGILSVQMVDPSSNRVIWQSEAIERVDSYMTPEERDESVRLSIQAIFKTFPPSGEKN
ncbi:DUF4136 domain-containing protein [Hahella sp. CCB-MM4]|uniref:DUF4136 domain-containing protein n=1 Tax=Hahella sp. (strain CCB-MM4) TaxID=1926491 RepID=UPI00143D029D|nr:DUF4136 domain-containing protein [Hahella sp. CCB-MM4]